MRSNYGGTINGLPLRLAFPRTLVYTRPFALQVEGFDDIYPLYAREILEERFPGKDILVIREEYEVNSRGRR